MTERQKQFLGSLIRWGLVILAARLIPAKAVPIDLLNAVLDDTTQQILGEVIGLGALVWSLMHKNATVKRVTTAEERARTMAVLADSRTPLGPQKLGSGTSGGTSGGIPDRSGLRVPPDL